MSLFNRKPSSKTASNRVLLNCHLNRLILNYPHMYQVVLELGRNYTLILE